MSKYMGQIMAECDCQHQACEMRGYCMAARIEELEAYARKATIALTETLSVGGSEFFAGKIGDMYIADVDHCVKHIKDRADGREKLGIVRGRVATLAELKGQDDE